MQELAQSIEAAFAGGELADAAEAVETTISVVKVNPRAEIVYYGTLRLDRKGDEATAVRFTVDPDGTVRDINTLPKQIVPQT